MTVTPRVRRQWLIGLLVLQIVCLGFLGTEATLDLYGIELEDLLGTRNFLEILVVTALALGAAATALQLRNLARRNARIEDRLRAASGAFGDLLNDHFTQWDLTEAERDVALMAIKGLSIAEIAAVRSTAEGTVKAQSNRIYKKAGVSNRAQLLSLFVEELLAEPLIPEAPANRTDGSSR